MGPIDSLRVVGINLRPMTRLAPGVLPTVDLIFPLYKIFLFVNFGVCVRVCLDMFKCTLLGHCP